MGAIYMVTLPMTLDVPAVELLPEVVFYKEVVEFGLLLEEALPKSSVGPVDY